jgi:putative Holliday junction resolvase
LTGARSSHARADLTYLGFDYGTSGIGVAVGQSLTCTARDLDAVRAKGSKPDWERISKHVEDWKPAAFVVGLPLDGSGGETEMSRRARRFGQTLADRYNLPVYWINEYLSSETARQVLRENRTRNARAYKDRFAARVILESFLNEHHRS